jgi:hypothetical protein
MTTLQKCPQCGAESPADAPEGLCPRCVLALGMGESGTESAGASAGFLPPKLDSLAPHFPQLEVFDLIGRGGMGAVYKARQPHLDRFVALKILPPEVGRDPAFADRFAREARTMARLNHRGIVTLYDFGLAGDYYYFLMEYVDGASLRQVIREGNLSPEEALAIVPQICDALQYAHDQGVVHRDIKPDNILIDRAGSVKIADFGLAKLFGQPPADQVLTATGQVMGTPHYMAPEQMQGAAAVDHRADIYALGVVFYELLTGELPLGRFPPPSEKVQLDVRLDQVVLRALEKDPERRYQHASEVKTDMDAISRGAASPAAADWRYDLGALALALGSLGVTAAGLKLSSSGYSLMVLLVSWLFLYMAVSRGAKLIIETCTLAGALALVGWGVWLEQSSWALLALVPAALGFGFCRHAYGRGWDDRFAEGYFLPAAAFLGVLGVVFLGMAVAESAWPMTVVLAVLAACMAGVFAAWPIVDEERWKQVAASVAEEEQPESAAAPDSETSESAKEDDDWGWGCLVPIGIGILISSGVFGFIGGAFGDLHLFLTEELPIDPRLRRPATLGVYMAALGVLCLFAWGVWRAAFSDPSRPEGEK